MGKEQLDRMDDEKRVQLGKENAVRKAFAEAQKQGQAEYREKVAWAKPIENMSQNEYCKWRQSGMSLDEWVEKKK